MHNSEHLPPISGDEALYGSMDDPRMSPINEQAANPLHEETDMVTSFDALSAPMDHPMMNPIEEGAALQVGEKASIVTAEIHDASKMDVHAKFYKEEDHQPVFDARANVAQVLQRMDKVNVQQAANPVRVPGKPTPYKRIAETSLFDDKPASQVRPYTPNVVPTRRMPAERAPGSVVPSPIPRANKPATEKLPVQSGVLNTEPKTRTEREAQYVRDLHHATGLDAKPMKAPWFFGKARARRASTRRVGVL